MIKVGVIGATGYAGVELVRLLLGHPEVKIEGVSSVSFTGQRLSWDVYPSLRHMIDDDVLVDDVTVIERCDVVFASLPHGLSQEIAAKCIDAGKLFVDLGADFRLEREDEYFEWYGGTFLDKNLHSSAAYGLPELFRKQVANCQLVANPGCYPTAATLGLAPIVSRYDFDECSIIIDAKSGVTGAGRNATAMTHFPQCNENLSPYAIAKHRHTPEIEQNLQKVSGRDLKVLFTPHLIPVNRGILSTNYIKTSGKMTEKDIHKLYCDFYRDEFFVRICPLGDYAKINTVTHSNFCDISIHKDERTGRIITVSVIDNMVKGAAGQAIQNMNIMCGFDEKAGLMLVPSTF